MRKAPAVTMKRFHPSSSFELQLPAQIEHRADGQVSSFWMDGEALLLQLSSFLKGIGAPTGARQRLQERIDRIPGQRNVWESPAFRLDGVESAAAEIMDESGCLWVHAYLVWPHLTVYATISGPEDCVHDRESWAMFALTNIKLNVQ